MPRFVGHVPLIHDEPARLLAKHRRKLAERPPAVFALGPKTRTAKAWTR